MYSLQHNVDGIYNCEDWKGLVLQDKMQLYHIFEREREREGGEKERLSSD